MKRGTVSVRDFKRRRTVSVKAGHSYIAPRREQGQALGGAARPGEHGPRRAHRLRAGGLPDRGSARARRDGRGLPGRGCGAWSATSRSSCSRAELASDPRLSRALPRRVGARGLAGSPDIVPIYEADEATGCLFIAMRYVEGTRPRRSLLDAGRLAPAARRRSRRRSPARSTWRTRRGLVHRDVKPSNVLVAPGAGVAEATPTWRTSASRDVDRRGGPCRRRQLMARSTTSLRNGSPEASSTAAPTCTRSAACSSSA